MSPAQKRIVVERVVDLMTQDPDRIVEQAKKAVIEDAMEIARVERYANESTIPALKSLKGNLDALIDAVRRAEHQKIKQLKAKHERAILKVVDERDRAQDAADELAYAITDESVIGEHSNLNNPWSNALDELEGERQRHAEALGKMQTQFSAEEQRAISAELVAFKQADQITSLTAEIELLAKAVVAMWGDIGIQDADEWLCRARVVAEAQLAALRDHQKGRHPMTALGTTLKEDSSFAWLIERYNGPKLVYWSGRREAGQEFTDDWVWAVRFARREDAEQVRVHVAANGDCCRSVMHGFQELTPQTSVEALRDHKNEDQGAGLAAAKKGTP